MVDDVGSVYTGVIGRVAVAGITGPAPGPGAHLLVLVFIPQAVWIGGVGVAGPAPTLSFA